MCVKLIGYAGLIKFRQCSPPPLPFPASPVLFSYMYVSGLRSGLSWFSHLVLTTSLPSWLVLDACLMKMFHTFILQTLTCCVLSINNSAIL